MSSSVGHRELGIIGFPVFARGLCIRGTTKDLGALGSTNAPILIGEVAIQHGDAVIGDADGVVILLAARMAKVVGAAQAREARERDVLARLRSGERTLEIYGLAGRPVDHAVPDMWLMSMPAKKGGRVNHRLRRPTSRFRFVED